LKKNHFIYSIFSFFILINCGISSDGKEGSTSSIKNSKEKNLWQATYLPNNNIIELKHDTFIIKEIWVEKRWLYRHNEMPETFKEKFGKDMYNIYLSFDKDAFSAFLKDDNITPFGFSLSDNKVINGISGTKLMGHLEKPFPDTLSFKYNVTKYKQDSILLFKKNK
jgi:hypothetical protein